MYQRAGISSGGGGTQYVYVFYERWGSYGGNYFMIDGDTIDSDRLPYNTQAVVRENDYVNIYGTAKTPSVNKPCKRYRATIDKTPASKGNSYYCTPFEYIDDLAAGDTFEGATSGTLLVFEK